jgi:hypothetical protein
VLACRANLSTGFGRRYTLFAGAVLFTLGGLVQTFSINLGVMSLGRIISGFGVGLLSCIVPIYQSEVSPAEHVRGCVHTNEVDAYLNSEALLHAWNSPGTYWDTQHLS